MPIAAENLQEVFDELSSVKGTQPIDASEGFLRDLFEEKGKVRSQLTSSVPNAHPSQLQWNLACAPTPTHAQHTNNEKMSKPEMPNTTTTPNRELPFAFES